MMRNYLSRAAISAFVLAQSLALGGCGGALRRAAEPTPPTAPKSPPTARIVQIGYGVNASFVVCSGSGCPSVTPKTLATATVPMEHAVTPASPLPPSLPEPGPAPQRAVVHFATDSARLDTTARRKLDALVPHLETGIRVLIQGRTDSTGKRTYNNRLAKQRAVAVQSYLVGAKPDVAKDVKLDARGDCCHVASNKTAAGRAKNRRAVVRLSPPAKPRAETQVPK